MRSMQISRIGSLALAVTLGVAAGALAQAPRLAAPNVVEISPRLVTSGQPTAQGLASLKALGFEADIYLAPLTVSDAIRDEPLIVTRQGLTFVNIPIPFDNPTEADFETFAGVLTGLGNRKVLVHCQVNMRASSMVFLYRTIVLKEDPHVAYQAVSGIWAPEGPWRRLIETELRKNKVAFELL
jgi:protein tyrosine phosphatase (PTP) superfamily phosphohydrolase (DUF442 family)